LENPHQGKAPVTEPGLLKNTLALAAPNFLNPVISFALVLLISRYLGVDGLGKYSLALAYMGMFATLATLGLDALIVREVARRPEDTQLLFFNVSLFGAVSAVVAIVGMNATVSFLGYGTDVTSAVFWCSLALLFATAIYYMNGVFVASYKAKYTAYSYLAENFFRVIISAGFVLAGYGIVVVFMVALATRALGFVMMSYFYLTSIGRPRWEFRADIWKTLVREAPVFSSIVIFSTIHMSLDQIMLSKLQGVASVGVYSAADRILAMCKTMPVAFAMALLPSMTTSFHKGPEEIRALVDSSIRRILILSVPVIVGVIILSDRFILLLYGEDFATSATLLRAHIISLLPFGTLFVLARALTATDNQKIDMYINALCALLNFILNLVLIPLWAEMGAVIATFVTVVIFNQLQYVFISRRLFRVDFISPIGRIIPATAIMGIVTYFLTPINLFVNVAVSALIYLVALYLMGALQDDEIRIIKRVVRLGRGND
jgi:O-antigen/teichoic acid export membrane protein